jgi:hypothetical protein
METSQMFRRLPDSNTTISELKGGRITTRILLFLDETDFLPECQPGITSIYFSDEPR